MPYKPGDNYCICDLTGKKVLMSDTRKTWDGLRVWKKVWYPKHPQLSIKAIPDRMAVLDGRPRPSDVSIYPEYGMSTIVLESSGGLFFRLAISDVGTVSAASAPWQDDVPTTTINSYELSVTDGGVIVLTASTTTTGPDSWLMTSPNGTVWSVTVTAGSFVTNAIG